MDTQKTLKKSVHLEGYPVYGNEPSAVMITPAPPGEGIMFVKDSIVIPARIANLDAEFTKWTSLQRKGITIHNVEHLLSALYGLGITNALIEVEGTGVPLLDCSALPFVEAIDSAGIEEQGVLRRTVLVWPMLDREWMTSFRTGHSDGRVAQILAFSDSKFSVSYLLDYGDTPLPVRYVDVVVTPENYRALVAPARTFMTTWEIDRWRGTLLSDYFCDTVPRLSADEMFKERYPGEAAWHKVLDMIGDLALVGAMPRGMFVGIRSGHSLNRKMARRLAGC